jgi:hypothetical protein
MAPSHSTEHFGFLENSCLQISNIFSSIRRGNLLLRFHYHLINSLFYSQLATAVGQLLVTENSNGTYNTKRNQKIKEKVGVGKDQFLFFSPKLRKIHPGAGSRRKRRLCKVL